MWGRAFRATPHYRDQDHEPTVVGSSSRCPRKLCGVSVHWLSVFFINRAGSFHVFFGFVFCGQRLWAPRRTVRFELCDVTFVLQGKADVIKTFHQPPARVVVDLELDGHIACGHCAIFERHCQFCAWVFFQDLPQQFNVCLGANPGDEALLA